MEKLLNDLKEIGHLNGALGLLYWDQSTYMPKGALSARSEQIGLLSRLVHQRKTSDEYKRELGKYVELDTGEIKLENACTEEKAILSGLCRDYRIDNSLPSEFVEDYSKHTMKTYACWEEARKENNFSRVVEDLDKMISLTRRKAEYLGYKDSPYNALLDLYEPKMTTKEVSTLFSPLRDATVELLQKIKAKGPVDDSCFKQDFEIEKQKCFGNEILSKFNFDLNHSRQDESAHPFTINFHPTDVRITTRKKEVAQIWQR